MLMLDKAKILFYSDPIDMRKSIDSLCVLVSEILHCDPVNGTLYLFRNRSGNKIKVLYYETNSFTIWYHRLEKGRYIFQRNLQGKVEMMHEHFRWLLASDKYAYRDAALPHEISHFY